MRMTHPCHASELPSMLPHRRTHVGRQLVHRRDLYTMTWIIQVCKIRATFLGIRRHASAGCHSCEAPTGVQNRSTNAQSDDSSPL